MRKIIFFIALFCGSLLYAETLVLRNNFQKAVPGDFIVITANKTDTLFHIYDKTDAVVTIEEIAVPDSKKPSEEMGWKAWVENNAPSNCSWVIYEIDLNTGKMLNYYSFTKNGWFEIAEADNFLSKLLNLKLEKVPLNSRKHIGLKPASEAVPKRIWNPPMIVEGKVIKGVRFDAWKTFWPQDQSDLSGKLIEVFLPDENEKYPSYFPYWLQISGAIGKAKVRIIDSGSGLVSPKHKEDRK